MATAGGILDGLASLQHQLYTAQMGQQQAQPNPSYNPHAYGMGFHIGSTNSTTTSSSTLTLDDAEGDPDGYQPPKPKIVEADEFKKLSNHKFHELLDKFEELRSKVI